jgi:hypothetical protein
VDAIFFMGHRECRSIRAAVKSCCHSCGKARFRGRPCRPDGVRIMAGVSRPDRRAVRWSIR